MTALLFWLGGIVGPKAAKPVLIVIAVLALVVALGVAKCSYDASVVENHENKRAADMLPKLRKADEGIVTTITKSDAQIARDEQELRNAIQEQPSQPITPRQRARACAILVRQHASAGTPAPADCVSAAGPGAPARP